MAKKIKSYIKLQVPSGQANPSPPVGPALGQHGVNIMEFCKAFNAESQQKGFDQGVPLPVIITVYVDRSFTFIIKTPPTAYLLLQAAKKEKGSGEPNQNKIATLTRADLEKIAEVKMPDLTAADMDAAVRTVAGSARSILLLQTWYVA